jgi:hypothetical protein
MKLRVFIGSASEDLNIANTIKNELQPEFECVVWDEKGVFKLSKTPLSSILEQIDDFDVGIFVFGAHDAVTSRGITSTAARDNVIFEHGLFAGRLGPERALVVRDDTANLKWPSDLKGFTPVFYDGSLAKTDARNALKNACEELTLHLRQLVPMPCIFLSGKRRPIGHDWWTYALVQTAKTDPSSLPSTYIIDQEGFEFAATADIGVRFPRSDSLVESRRYCAFRIRATHATANPRLYVALRADEFAKLLGHDTIYLALSDFITQAGWGPANEFKVRLPNLTDNHWHTIIIDFSRFIRFIGDKPTVTGFRLRPGLKLSHVCMFDEMPTWLKNAEEITPDAAPYINIKHPNDDDYVNYEEEVNGESNGAGNLQALVFSGDMWHPQAKVQMSTSGNWTTTCKFGYPPNQPVKSSLSSTHILAVITCEHLIKERTPTLPDAIARDLIRVKRR